MFLSQAALAMVIFFCSGSSTNDVTWLSLQTTGNIYNGDRIRICYFGGGNGFSASTGLQTTNSLYLRFV